MDGEPNDFSPLQKSKTLKAILVSMLIGNMMVANIDIVLPDHVNNFGADGGVGWTVDPETGSSTKPSKT